MYNLYEIESLEDIRDYRSYNWPGENGKPTKEELEQYGAVILYSEIKVYYKDDIKEEEIYILEAALKQSGYSLADYTIEAEEGCEGPAHIVAKKAYKRLRNNKLFNI